MKNLLNPKLLFIINTLPVFILVLIFFSNFSIVKSILEPKNITSWNCFNFGLISILSLQFIGAIYYSKLKKRFGVLFSLVFLFLNSCYIYLFFSFYQYLIPVQIPAWMISSDFSFYVVSFIMPSILYYVIVLVSHTLKKNKDYKPYKSLIVSFAIPVGIYLIFQFLIPATRFLGNNQFITHSFIIFVIISIALFFFFLLRVIYILLYKRKEFFSKNSLLWKIPLCIILPIVGLLLNNAVLSDKFGVNVFGDFSNYWFYILAICNGVLLCLPNIKTVNIRILLFGLKSVSLIFSLYFFLVFLPYTALSFIAIFAFGLGLLMICPIILFLIHLYEINQDIKFLKKHIKQNILILIFSCSFSLIPSFIIAKYLSIRWNLFDAIEYVFYPDYDKEYDIDIKQLKRSLKFVKQHKIKSDSKILSSRTPYLTNVFNWIVLDNLSLSDKKINKLERVFIGKYPESKRHSSLGDSKIEITNLKIKSYYNKKSKFWKSNIELEITNKSTLWWNAEYSTVFKLPKWAWISDYYLYINGKKEKAILAERKSALWVYNRIRNTRRDPGILFYNTGENIEFKIFPFAPGEVKNTGIEIIHKKEVDFSIDNFKFKLGNDLHLDNYSFENNDIAIVSSEAKKKLELCQRTPYFHFIVDKSFSSKLTKLKVRNLIAKSSVGHHEMFKGAKISFVNSEIKNYDFDSIWDNYPDIKIEGGFFLKRAISKLLVQSYNEQSDSYPVFIIISNHMYDAVLDGDFSDMEIAFPESKYFYHMDDLGELTPHSLVENSIFPMDLNMSYDYFYSNSYKFKTREGRVFYIENSTKPSLVLKNYKVDLESNEIKYKDWRSGVFLKANWIGQNFNPYLTKLGYNNLLKYSFKTSLLTPVSSFIALENEAQKEVLKRKQKNIINGNHTLDLTEVDEMTEPSMYVLIFMLVGILFVVRKRSFFNKK